MVTDSKKMVDNTLSTRNTDSATYLNIEITTRFYRIAFSRKQYIGYT